MRDVLKRIERLEQMRAPKGRVDRIVRQLVGMADEGGPVPWNPTWASSRNREQAVTRLPDETAEAFETRANAELSGFTILVGGDPIPEIVRAAMV